MEPGGIQRVGIVANPKVSEGYYFERLVTALKKGGVRSRRSGPTSEPDGTPELDLVFVLGGDGTMLRAARMYPGRVLLGVNLGKVGFMSGMLPDEMETGVEKVLGGGLEVQEYRMLEVRGVDGGPHLGRQRRGADQEAAPPAHLGRRLHRRGRVVRVQVRRLYRGNTFRLDGVRALGRWPIISGDAGCYVLVPIAPHALVSRPLVLGEDQVAELKLVGREALLSLDGDDPREVPADGRIEIGLSRQSVRIGRTEDWSWWRAVRRTFL
jgi:NAD+ kinase